MATTTLSSRGQVVIPKTLRDSRHWSTGTSFVVEEVPQGVLLKPMSTFAHTRLDDVMGCAGYSGPALSRADIEVALDSDVRRRYASK